MNNLQAHSVPATYNTLAAVGTSYIFEIYVVKTRDRSFSIVALENYLEQQCYILIIHGPFELVSLDSL